MRVKVKDFCIGTALAYFSCFFLHEQFHCSRCKVVYWCGYPFAARNAAVLRSRVPTSATHGSGICRRETRKPGTAPLLDLPQHLRVLCQFSLVDSNACRSAAKAARISSHWSVVLPLSLWWATFWYCELPRGPVWMHPALLALALLRAKRPSESFQRLLRALQKPKSARIIVR